MYERYQDQPGPRPTRRKQPYRASPQSFEEAGYGVRFIPESACCHTGEAVFVGDYTVYPGGSRYVPFPQYGDYLFVALDHNVMDVPFGARMIQMVLPDFGGVPLSWRQTLEGTIIPLLQSGEQLYPFCIGSHGRTGTFLASLIALLEPNVDDPIAQVRYRHCARAVETVAQGQAIFDLLGKPMPAPYQSSLMPTRVMPARLGPASPRPGSYGKRRS